MPTGNNGSNIMKTRNLVIMCAVVALVFSSCNITRTYSTARTLDPATQSMVADLEVANMKVTGEFKYDVRKNTYVNEQELKDNAVYNALKTMKADVLVAPQYQIVKEISGRKYYTVTVTGYPAFYRNFRPVEYERVTNVEMKEMNGMTFLLTKNNFGETVGYQVVVPVDKKVRTIDADQTLLDQLSLDQVALDQVILKARDERKGASVVKSEASSQEKENIFTKVAKKTTSKKKSSKTKK